MYNYYYYYYYYYYNTSMTLDFHKYTNSTPKTAPFHSQQRVKHDSRYLLKYVVSWLHIVLENLSSLPYKYTHIIS
jgi:hypothetical protein